MEATIHHYISVHLSVDEAREIRKWIDGVGCSDDDGVPIESAQALYSQLGTALRLSEVSQ